MISLDCHHPDLEEFIDIKTEKDRVQYANISVRITDDFMRAVRNNDDWTMSFTRPETGETITRTAKARYLFHKFCENNWNWAEPGMLYWDTINRRAIATKISQFCYDSVNPCAEEPLPADGSCLLGSINLAAFVNNYGLFDYCSFQDAVRICVRGLNEVLDEGMPLHPLKGQRRVARDWRQIGLGIMGLSDMFIKMQIRYGSQEAINAVDVIGDMMATVAIEESVNLAEQYGAFPKFDKEILKSPFIYEHTSPEMRGRIAKYGMRNSQLLTIPPTGSIASLIGCGYGVEPVFANYYTRTTKSIHKDENGNAVDVVYKMYSGLAKQYADEHGLTETDDLPDYFIDAQHLDYHERLDMQAAWQRHIDASISSTVNVPQDFTVEQVESMYMEAWEKGLKGVTMFRAGCMRAPILDAGGDKKEDAAKEEQATAANGVVYNSISPVSRKTLGTTHGDTYSCKCACGTLYITVNRDDDGNVVETFVHTSKGGVCQANIAAVSRMVSLALRSGVKIDEIVDQLRGINCPACANRKSHGEDLSGLSCPDIISRVLKDFAGRKDAVVQEHREAPAPEPVTVAEEDATKLDVCPVCGKPLTHTGGCAACMECGWQKCNG